MDLNAIGTKVLDFVKKYRYPILVLVLGLVLMCIPSVSGSGKEESAATPTQSAARTDLSAELSEILSQIEGAGKVRVMLTVAAGERTVYQVNENITTDEAGSAIRKETVIITDSDRNEQALVTQILPQEYRGAVIVCQGADSAAVRLAIVEAVSRITGLGADRISVLKMK